MLFLYQNVFNNFPSSTFKRHAKNILRKHKSSTYFLVVNGRAKVSPRKEKLPFPLRPRNPHRIEAFSDGNLCVQEIERFDLSRDCGRNFLLLCLGENFFRFAVEVLKVFTCALFWCHCFHTLSSWWKGRH